MNKAYSIPLTTPINEDNELQIRNKQNHEYLTLKAIQESLQQDIDQDIDEDPEKKKAFRQEEAKEDPHIIIDD